jgi:AraC-like DNA-binding protein
METIQAHPQVRREARMLSDSSCKSIIEIALDSGFVFSSTFAWAFKGFQGVSVSGWRKTREKRKNGTPGLLQSEIRFLSLNHDNPEGMHEVEICLAVKPRWWLR